MRFGAVWLWSLAASGAAQVDPVVVQARAAENPGQYFGAAEYPPRALRRGEQGRVIARLAIDATGHVAGCAVASSSGSAELDAAVCRIAGERVRFAPARDDKGRAIASTYMLPVRWVLPTGGAAPPLNNDGRGWTVSNDPPAPATPTDVADVALIANDADPAGQVITLSLEVDEVGHLASCSMVNATGSPGLAAKACDRVRHSVAFQPALEHGRPVRRTTVQRFLFHRPLPISKARTAPRVARTGTAEGWLGSADYPAAALRRGKEGTTGITWDVTETGAVENCRVTVSSGFAELDKAACDAVIRRAHFAPAKDASGKAVRSTRTQAIGWRLH